MFKNIYICLNVKAFIVIMTQNYEIEQNLLKIAEFIFESAFFYYLCHFFRKAI